MQLGITITISQEKEPLGTGKWINLSVVMTEFLLIKKNDSIITNN